MSGMPSGPLAARDTDARAFADAGRRLSDLHIGYETLERYPVGGEYAEDAPAGEAAYGLYAGSDKKMRFGKPTPEQKAGGQKVDRTVIHFSRGLSHAAAPRGRLLG